MVLEAISKTRKSVSSGIQTPRSRSKKLGCASFFQPTSRGLEILMKYSFSCLIYYVKLHMNCQWPTWLVINSRATKNITSSPWMGSLQGYPQRFVTFLLTVRPYLLILTPRWREFVGQGFFLRKEHNTMP